MTVWTTGVGIPLGSLLSFGSSASSPSAGDRLIFSGAGAVSADPDNTAPQLVVAGQNAIELLTGKTFGTEKTGWSGMPYKDSTWQWTYYIAATAGLSEAATWADLEYRLKQIYAWFWGTYTYSNSDGSVTYSGASGQKGDLLVKDAAAGNVRVARAAWLSFPAKPVPGEIAMYQMDVVFSLLSHFS